MTVPANKDEALERLNRLVDSFSQNEAAYAASGSNYNETQARTDFITPFLEILGWDVHNHKGLSQSLREVFEEATVEVGEERLAKKPDYELRLARQRKLFVEAKKPCVPISTDKAPAFQTRRYGFSASLPISVLTNFQRLSIYDCIPAPDETHEAHVARILEIDYHDYIERFDELYSLISRDAVYSGSFDAKFNVGVSRQGAQQFDDHFLDQVRSWRIRLANDLHEQRPSLSSSELTYLVQLFISRLVFLRICEDREIEKYETLRHLPPESTFSELTSLLKRADEFYDSGLFCLLNDEAFDAQFSDDLLKEIIDELYYPLSPYSFSVVEATVLGEIYELFLSEVINIKADGTLEIVDKPEIRDSGGVYTTPQFIVDEIVESTLAPLVSGNSSDDLESLTIADICCGSGVFLIGSFDYLLNYYLSWHLEHKDSLPESANAIYETTQGSWRLQFAEKRRILLRHIRGVDIDYNAAEVARFSLCLKLIEDEHQDTLTAFVEESGQPVLPSLDDHIKSGNSLVSHAELRTYSSSETLPENLSSFTWQEEFSREFEDGGFTAIVGNPPYIRIQKMVAYAPDEVSFFQSPDSPYSIADSDNFDKYELFVERSLSLIHNAGRVGIIIPHKFMTTAAGQSLRAIIAENERLTSLVHFGTQQVFGPNISNYTCLLTLSKLASSSFTYERVSDLSTWRYRDSSETTTYPSSTVSSEPWSFVSVDVDSLFAATRERCTDTLHSLADIFVGVQTSNDDVYIVQPIATSEESITIVWNDKQWELERDVLRPCLQDVQLTAYSPPTPNRFIIFPYTVDSNRVHLIQPDVMQSDYPGVWEYLCARQKILEERSITGGIASERQFYQYGRSQSLKKFNTTKVILPVLSLEPRYCLDDTNIVVTGGGNGPYYLIQPKDGELSTLHFLLAVLCHPLSEARVRTKTSVFRGGYYSHGKQYIKNLPVPPVTDDQKTTISSLVARLIESYSTLDSVQHPHKRTQQKRQIKSLRSDIEQHITHLFQMTPEQMDTARQVPVPV